MSAIFTVLAAAMLVAALILVLRPLLSTPVDPRMAQRRALDQALAAGVIDASEHAAKRAALDALPATPATTTRPWLLAAAIALALSGGTLGVYLTQGTPAALDPAALTASAPAQDLDSLLEGLRARLAEAPEDPQGWALLARGYRSVGRIAEAADAYARAIALTPTDADLLVEGAETLAMSRPDRSLAGEPSTLLARALAIAPEHQRGLWLTGIAYAQAGELEPAIATWTRLVALLEPGSEVARAVAEQIAEARQRLGGVEPETGPTPEPVAVEPAVAATVADGAETAAGTAPARGTAAASVKVVVDLDPAIAARVPAGAALFVFARAAEGPRVPLAIARLPAAGFPVTVTLDDSKAMVPGMTLSSQPRVVVGARISASGNATPQPGDLEALSDPVVHAELDGPLRLTIARVLP